MAIARLKFVCYDAGSRSPLLKGLAEKRVHGDQDDDVGGGEDPKMAVAKVEA